jgi:hypothetical protein
MDRGNSCISFRRVALQHKWRKAAQKERAASISIVNDVDEEEIPNVGENFIYYERKYIKYVLLTSDLLDLMLSEQW